MKSLAKNVGDRYPSAAAMKADIDRYLEGKPVQAPAVAAAPATAFVPTDTPTPTTTRWTEDDEEPERKRRGPLILLLLLLVALIVAALVFGPQLFQAAPEQQSVPTITGLTRDQAERTIQRQRAPRSARSTTAASEDVAEGRVISQEPEAGDLVDPDAQRRLRRLHREARGPAARRGRPEQGRRRPPAAQRGPARGAPERDATSPKDQVVEMQPPAGTEVSEGSKVTLFWSDGPEKVPNVIGKNEGEATGPDRGRRASRSAG